MPNADALLAERLLDALERIEYRALVWGLVDRELDVATLNAQAVAVLESAEGQKLTRTVGCTIRSPDGLISRLAEMKMLFAASPGPNGTTGWRTRMSEGVRLFAQLRQMLPRHKGSAWTGAAPLVADYRLMHRPRRYPRRNLGAGEVLDAVEPGLRDPLLAEALRHWLSGLRADGGLSRFQVDATQRLLAGLEAGTRTATLVAAGTGSGKTFAFYVPALSWLAARKVAAPAERRVRILALYPRSELLKDQLAGVYRQLRAFDPWVTAQGALPLRVGVLYGDTPFTDAGASRSKAWHGDQHGPVCPFMRCPGCGDPLNLVPQDAGRQKSRLRCAACRTVIDTSLLAFTRESMLEEVPDVLISTIEMLNRQLSDPEFHRLIGVGSSGEHAPDLVLLDEVHLLSGAYGAQAAYLLRRWSAASGRRSSFAALSATIAGGRDFLATLTGLDPSVVQEIRPREEDMESEGAEYALVLRGDPASQKALLSTSIQALMLGTRLLDPQGKFHPDRHPFHGWRAFAFADQMDSTNRLFINLLDAEGRGPDGRPNLLRHPEGGLARLRQPDNDDSARHQAGQDWRVPDQIGHALTDRLDVARTTAYDRGVSPTAQVIVATAALEVGFDDPGVGLVLQHKAPRDVASFLQRRGRAGRTRHMRPWTVVVLSDYGRDRLAYQAYDRLLEPELPPRLVPVSNRYVQRMQAVYALIDELGTRMAASQGRIWDDLAAPPLPPEGWTEEEVERLKELADARPVPLSTQDGRRLFSDLAAVTPARFLHDRKRKWSGADFLKRRLRSRQLVPLLHEILRSPAQLEDLSRRIADRLALSREEADVLLWFQPRPVITGAMPTALRRLSSGWRGRGGPGTDIVAGHPLPDYVPSNLFSDLSLPEVRLRLPPAFDSADGPQLPVQQGLAEFAPGKVSRRFDRPLWIGFSSPELQDMFDGEEDTLERTCQLGFWYATAGVSRFRARIGGAVVQLEGYRPLELRLSDPLDDRRAPVVPGDRSNAQLRWASSLLAPRSGRRCAAPAHLPISSLVSDITVHVHAEQSAALVRRYATGSRAELRLQRGATQRAVTVECSFVDDDGLPAGVGFEIDTDAVRVALRLPDALHAAIDWTDGARLRAVRAARLRYEVARHAGLCAVVPSPFMRGWIMLVVQVAAVVTARKDNLDLASALDRVLGPHARDIVDEVLRSVFGVPEASDDDEDGTGADDLRGRLLQLLASDAVREQARDLARVLTGMPDAGWDRFLSETLRATLGAALLDAMQQACPQIDSDSLVLDVDPGPDDDSDDPRDAEFWISELSPGGSGLIEQVAELLASEPDTLWRHWEASLAAGDLERVDAQLRQVVRWLGGPAPDSALSGLVAGVRTASGSAEARRAAGDLRAALIRRGQSTFHGYGVALSMRLLRSGATPAMDGLLHEVLEEWEILEERLGIEIDSRVICASHGTDTRLDRALELAGFTVTHSDLQVWRVNTLSGLLWARGHAVRAAALQAGSRFVTPEIETERLLVASWLRSAVEPVDPSLEGWLEKAHEHLRTRSMVVLRLDAAKAEGLVPAITAAMVAEPVLFEYLSLYPTLCGVGRTAGAIDMTYRIPEAR